MPTAEALKARFELIDLENGHTVYQSFSDSITGEFLISIPVQSNYMLNASRRGYLFYSENFSLRGTYNIDRPFLKDVPLQPIQVGKSIVLKNVFYEVDSFTLKIVSEAELNKVVKFLQQNPHIKIEISGHTDNTGNPDYNQVLSENRAKTVTAYLIASAIDAGRIVSKGYGMNMPVASNDTEEGRAQNRRTELKIIE
jgi:outer membrane protein OmpA-like peptidoglycan-associated protein